MIAGRFFRHSVLYALLGMALGIYMAASHDHVQAPAHAHLNLLGFVAMGLYGLFYKAWPAAESDRLAAAHFWISNIGVVGLIGSLVLLLADVPAAEPLAAASSFVVLGGMVLFTVIVFRATRTA